jgi:hypothetical protein
MSFLFLTGLHFRLWSIVLLLVNILGDIVRKSMRHVERTSQLLLTQFHGEKKPWLLTALNFYSS